MKLKSREEELDSIKRFVGYADVMFYRSSVLTHCKRVNLIVRELNKYIDVSAINKKLAETLALVHDDTEIITGDILAQNKMNYSKKEQQEYEQRCNQAIQILVDNYPSHINDFNYMELFSIRIHI